MRDACATLGIPYGHHTKGGFTPHSLRKTFRTEMRDAQVDRDVTAEAGGWEKGSKVMDAVYSDVEIRHLRAAQAARYKVRQGDEQT